MAARTRRQFLREAAAGLSAAAMAGCFPEVGGEWTRPRPVCQGQLPPPPVDPSRVVEAYSASALSTSAGTTTVDAIEVQAMVDGVLASLAGGAASPWSVLLPDATSATRVGIKVNALNRSCATTPALVRALCDSLKAGLGLPPEQILVWDRSDEELLRAGFTPEAVGAAVVSTTGSAASPGPGYEGAYCLANGKMTRLSRVLTELTDLTINCPVLKTHEVSGVTAGLKNVYGVIDNPGDFHADLATALPAIYALEPIRGRIRLTILDALQAVTLGGTADPPDATPGRIAGSLDPLAADSRALAIVNQIRAEKGSSAVDAAATSWLENARALGLGALAYDLVSV